MTFHFHKKATPLANLGVECCNPSEVIHESGRVLIVRCKAAQESKCKFCASIHRGYLRSVAGSGIPRLDVDKPLWTAFVTITAPGIDKLPWDKNLCRVSGEHVCSGLIGCVSDIWQTALWNEETKQNWNWFMTGLERRLGIDLAYWKSWELQARGALHVHALIRHRGISQAVFDAAVRVEASVWGFGEQVKILAVTNANRAEFGAYVTVYVTKGSNLGNTFDKSTGEVKQGGYRAWSASRDWGTSMWQVQSISRARAVAWALAMQGNRATARAVAIGVQAEPLDVLYEKLRN